jgi:hypothetical protein
MSYRKNELQTKSKNENIKIKIGNISSPVCFKHLQRIGRSKSSSSKFEVKIIFYKKKLLK